MWGDTISGLILGSQGFAISRIVISRTGMENIVKDRRVVVKGVKMSWPSHGNSRIQLV